MSTCPGLTFLTKQSATDGRIEEKSHIMGLVVDFILEEQFIEVKSERNRPHYYRVKLVASLRCTQIIWLLAKMYQGSTRTNLEELQHSLLELRSINFLRPLILPRRIPVTANFHGFFRVGCFGSQGRDFGWICRLCHAFTANLDITTICPRVFPCEF